MLELPLRPGFCVLPVSRVATWVFVPEIPMSMSVNWRLVFDGGMGKYMPGLTGIASGFFVQTRFFKFYFNVLNEDAGGLQMLRWI